MKFVVDTNVLVVANDRTTPLGQTCGLTCRERLEDILLHHQLVLDSLGLILLEYKKELGLSGKPGYGRFFFKWMFDRRFNPEHCELISIALKPDREDDAEFEEFPDDLRLAKFDRSDRKFVAVVLAHPDKPPVLNATDRDWWDYRHPLVERGVQIDFICPERMAQIIGA